MEYKEDPSIVRPEERDTLEGKFKAIRNGEMNGGRRFFLEPIFDTLEKYKNEEEKERGTPLSLKEWEDMIDMFIEEAQNVKKAISAERLK